MDYIGTTLVNLLQQTAFCNLTYGNFLMIGVALVFLYLAIRKGFEPLLLVPIAFGMLLVNIYPDIMAKPEDMSNGCLLYTSPEAESQGTSCERGSDVYGLFPDEALPGRYWRTDCCREPGSG